jgi:predicted O-methyltransferase YrrM
VFDYVEDRTAKLRRVRDDVLARGAVVDRFGETHSLSPVAIGREEGLALRDRVLREDARDTLEVGLGYGIAALFICDALLEGGASTRHVAIDPYQITSLSDHDTRFAGVGLQLLEEAGVRDIIEFHEEESQIVLPRLLADGRRFDLAFIDGSHRFESVFLDLVYCGRLLKAGGIVFADDAQVEGVRKAIDFCVANLRWSIEGQGAEGPAHSWMVLRTGPASLFRRPYTAFVNF